MFLSKLKNAATLMTVALILTAGAGAWRYGAIAGQSGETTQDAPAPGTPKGGKDPERRIYSQPTPSAVREVDSPQAQVAMAPPIVPAPRPKHQYLIDVDVIEFQENGKRKEVANPKLLALEGEEAVFTLGQPERISVGDGKREQHFVGTTIHATVRGGKEDKVRLDMTVQSTVQKESLKLQERTRRITEEISTEPGSRLEFTVGDKDSTPLVIIVAVQELIPLPREKTMADAESYLKKAEYWRRTGHPGSALCYYQELSQQYAGTLYAERANERMIEMERQLLSRKNLCEADQFLKDCLIRSKKQEDKPRKQFAESEVKPPARVWRIFIVGNKKISDEVILEQVQLYPGKLLSLSDLRLAEKKLSQLKGLKSNPKVTVIDHEDQFKDIRITLEEK